MNPFTYNYPVKIYFGEKAAANNLAAELAGVGTNVMLAYGGGSIKRNGAYDAVVDRLKEAGIPYAEMGGVAPNPRYESVLEGNRICREQISPTCRHKVFL